jgi:hypothetical protein
MKSVASTIGGNPAGSGSGSSPRYSRAMSARFDSATGTVSISGDSSSALILFCPQRFEVEKINRLLPAIVAQCRPASAQIASVSKWRSPRQAKRHSGKTFRFYPARIFQRKTSRANFSRHCEPRKPAARTCQDAKAKPRVRPACRCQIHKSKNAARRCCPSVCALHWIFVWLRIFLFAGNRAVIGDGTINCSLDNSPRQSSRGRVSKSDMDLPAHKSGLSGKSASMISSVCCPLSSMRIRLASQRSRKPAAVTDDCRALLLIHTRPFRDGLNRRARATRLPCTRQGILDGGNNLLARDMTPTIRHTGFEQVHNLTGWQMRVQLPATRNSQT